MLHHLFTALQPALFLVDEALTNTFIILLPLIIVPATQQTALRYHMLQHTACCSSMSATVWTWPAIGWGSTLWCVLFHQQLLIHQQLLLLLICGVQLSGLQHAVMQVPYAVWAGQTLFIMRCSSRKEHEQPAKGCCSPPNRIVARDPLRSRCWQRRFALEISYLFFSLH